MQPLERSDTDPPFVADADAPTTAGEVVRRSLEESVNRLDGAIPVIERGGDIEGVHQARVATRRLRSDLEAFGSLWVPEWADELRREIKWLGAVLGVARDADILHERFSAHASGWSSPERSRLGPMMHTIASEDERANEELRTILRGDRAGAIVDRLRQAGLHPAFTEDAALAGSTLAVGVREEVAAFGVAVVRAGEGSTDELLHRVRIAAKRVRYPAETIVAVVPDAQAVALSAEATQELLGQHHDAVVAEGWLLRFGAPDLAADERSTADAIRAIWPETARSVLEAGRALAR